MKLLKEIAFKSSEAQKQGKRIGDTDLRYQKILEQRVCDEFSVALGEDQSITRQRLQESLYS